MMKRRQIPNRDEQINRAVDAATGPAPKRRSTSQAAPAASAGFSRPVQSIPRAGVEDIGGVGVLNPPKDAVARAMQQQEMETTGVLRRRGQVRR